MGFLDLARPIIAELEAEAAVVQGDAESHPAIATPDVSGAQFGYEMRAEGDHLAAR
jgi:hypothetical protein